jgi:hypothetical protein
VLVELKGLDYFANDFSGSGSTKNRNTHDLGILDSLANLNLILENKVWYHFDGAKGAKVAKGTPRIVMSNFSPWRIAVETSAKRFRRSATVVEFMRDKVS